MQSGRVFLSPVPGAGLGLTTLDLTSPYLLGPLHSPLSLQVTDDANSRPPGPLDPLDVSSFARPEVQSLGRVKVTEPARA